MKLSLKRLISLMSVAICLVVLPSVTLSAEAAELTVASLQTSASGATTALLATNYDIDGTTLLSSKDYDKWLQYNDDLTNQVGWGKVEIAEHVTDDGIHYWFVTDPDPGHAGQARCTLIDFDATTHDDVSLRIPSSVAIDVDADGAISENEIFSVTSLGWVNGDSYLTPNDPTTNVDILSGDSLEADKNLITYWYRSAANYTPSWYTGDTVSGIDRHKMESRTSELTETYAIQHPFLELNGGSNNTLFEPAGSNASQQFKRYVSAENTALIASPASKVVSVTIPASVKEISGYAFNGCANLSTVEFEDGSELEAVGAYAFGGTGITDLVLPDNLKALDGRQYLTNNVLTRSDYTKAIDECWDRYIDENGDFITADMTDRLVNVRTSGGVLSGMAQLAHVSFSAGTDIDTSSKGVLGNTLVAFSGLSSLSSIIVREVGSGASNSYSVKDSVIYNADETAILFVPEQITGSVTLPEGIIVSATSDKTILGAKFQNRKGLSTIILGTGITAVPSNAFNGCESLKNVEMLGEVTAIGNGSFKDCKSLETIVLPETLSTITKNAFTGCSSLDSIVVPSKVKSLQSTTFSGCSSLQNVVIENPDEISIANSVFEDDYALKKLEIKSSSITFSDASNYEAFKSKNADYCSDVLCLILSGDVTSISSTNGTTFKQDNFLAKTLLIYGRGNTTRDFFTTAGGAINEENVALKTPDGVNVSVYYSSIDDGIYRIGESASANLGGLSNNAVYTGYSITPATLVYGSGDDAITLVEGTDYTLSYSDNLKPGTATVTVEGVGDYVGTLSATFEIVDAEGQAAADEEAVAALLDGIAALPSADQITADNADGIAAVDAAASAYIAMNDAQKSGIGVDALQTLVEAQAKVAEVKEQIAADAQEQAAKEREAAEQAAAEAKAKAEQLEKDVAAAKAEAAAAKTEAASAKSEASAAKAEAANAKASASTALAKAKLTKKTKSAKKGKVTVAWEKVAGATGYEVKVGAKTYTVKKASTLKKTVKAAKGKKVKVRVRAFKKQGDNTLYGPWSKAKKVKVKK